MRGAAFGRPISRCELRGKAAELGAAVDPMVWRESACPDVKDPARGLDPMVAARVHAQPHSAQSYLLELRPDRTLCDPDPLISAAGGSLDLRLVMSSAPHGHEVVTSLAAAAASANARGLTAIEMDLALADGDLLRSLAALGYGADRFHDSTCQQLRRLRCLVRDATGPSGAGRSSVYPSGLVATTIMRSLSGSKGSSLALPYSSGWLKPAVCSAAFNSSCSR